MSKAIEFNYGQNLNNPFRQQANKVSHLYVSMRLLPDFGRNLHGIPVK